jgi:hypothetical protein
MRTYTTRTLLPPLPSNHSPSMMMMYAAGSYKTSLPGILFHKTPIFTVTTDRKSNLTILSVFENSVLTNKLAANTEKWQSLGYVSCLCHREASAFWRIVLSHLYEIKIVGHSGGRPPRNVARRQGVTSQTILFVSNAGIPTDIMGQRVQITPQSAFRYVMETIHLLGHCSV